MSNVTYRTINARRVMRKGTKIVLAIVGGLFAIPVILGFVIGTVHAINPPAKPIVNTTDQVTSFNDGFADSKRDDCQQGFKAACDWLQGINR